MVSSLLQVTWIELIMCRFYNIVLYQIVLSCIIGAIIGYVARKVLRFSEERK